QCPSRNCCLASQARPRSTMSWCFLDSESAWTRATGTRSAPNRNRPAVRVRREVIVCSLKPWRPEDGSVRRGCSLRRAERGDRSGHGREKLRASTMGEISNATGGEASEAWPAGERRWPGPAPDAATTASPSRPQKDDDPARDQHFFIDGSRGSSRSC